MQESFDPYVVWLGFPPGQQPKNYYELLGLPLFEADPEKITRAADTLRGQIRQIRPGPHLAEWRQLLDELNAAKICLLDAVAKSAYDASLQAGIPSNLTGMSGYSSEAQPSRGYTPPTETPPSPPPGPPMVPPVGYSYPPYQDGSATPSGVPYPSFTPSPNIPSYSIYPNQPTFTAQPSNLNLPAIPPQSGAPFQPGPNWMGYYPSGGGDVGMPGPPISPPAEMPPQSGYFPSPQGSYPPAPPYGPQTGWESTYPMPTQAGSGAAGPLPTGWPPGQGGNSSSGQGISYGAPGAVPQAVGYSAPSEILAPPRPGEKTSVAAKTALGSRRSVERMVVVCVLLVALVGILVYLLQRVRSEGPEVLLGKESSPKNAVSEGASSSYSEERSSAKSSNGNSQAKGKSSPQHTPLEKGKPSPSKDPLGAPGSSGPSSSAEKSSPPKETSEPGNSTSPKEVPQKHGEANPSPAPKPSLDPAKQAAWKKAVGEVREALAQHDLASAEDYLKTAEANAQTSQERDEVERLRALRHYLDQFWQGIRQSVSSLEAAQEFVVGNTRFAIVEGNAQQLVVRIEGRNVRWPIEKIPGSIVEILAKRWFRTNEPGTKLAWGAYSLVKGNTERAKQLWEEARKAGADVGDLLEELSCWPLPDASVPPSSKTPLQ